MSFCFVTCSWCLKFYTDGLPCRFFVCTSRTATGLCAHTSWCWFGGASLTRSSCTSGWKATPTTVGYHAVFYQSLQQYQSTCSRLVLMFLWVTCFVFCIYLLFSSNARKLDSQIYLICRAYLPPSASRSAWLTSCYAWRSNIFDACQFGALLYLQRSTRSSQGEWFHL